MNFSVGVVASIVLFPTMVLWMILFPLRIVKYCLIPESEYTREKLPDIEVVGAVALMCITLAALSDLVNQRAKGPVQEISEVFGISGGYAAASFFSLVGCFVLAVLISGVWLLAVWRRPNRNTASSAGRVGFVMIFIYAAFELSRVIVQSAGEVDNYARTPNIIYYIALGILVILPIYGVILFVWTVAYYWKYLRAKEDR